MARCLQLAAKGLGLTYPNPMVGCVIVHQGRIIGEGWHRKAGESHAEVIAIDAVADKSLLKDSELYVNLEPCSHQGRTPPCADLIVRHQIPRVFIGSLDDNQLVSGKGIQRLRSKGIEVATGILERSCRNLNKRFFTFHQKKRPYIILKWAESSDGFLFPSPKEGVQAGPVWISNAFSRQLVHKWRGEEQAILVGTRTVIQDDPNLTVRNFQGMPILRLVIDRERKLSDQSNIFKGSYETLVYYDADQEVSDIKEEIAKNVRLKGLNFDQRVPDQIVDDLWRSGLQSVIIEGGAQTLNGFIDSGLWDEARVFIGRSLFQEGIRAPRLDDFPRKEQGIGDDRLLWIRNEPLSQSQKGQDGY